ncbi:MAG TPA: hypothetical protein VFV99_00945 [Kofleriaceae bacterium]|nr:hypothetical protein [Kofleriaceae bacterium]
MRGLVALLVLVIASCARGGVEFVVEPKNDTVTKVALYVGLGDAYTESIMPPQHSTPFPKSSAWVRDNYNELDVREVSAGKPVVFQFQGGDKLGVVIAIGYAGDTPVSAAVAHAIEVPREFIARYDLVLEPIANNANTASPLFLDVWQSTAGSPEAGKTCVALFDKRTTSADAVVTDLDPDCDGWRTGDAKECQPNFFMSYARPQLSDTACLVTERVVSTDGTTNDACVLGGPPCRDGVGRENGCTAPSAYCMPKSVCGRCTNMTGNQWDCARDITPLAAQYPSHIHCKLYYDAAGGLCPNPIKALSQPPANIGGHFCKTSGEFPQITSIGLDWNNSIQFTDAGATLKVDVKNLQPNCNFEIVVSGSPGLRHTFAGLVAAELDNGRGVAVPIVFDVDPLNVGCDAQIACQATWSWDLSELVDQCVNTPVFPP